MNRILPALACLLLAGGALRASDAAPSLRSVKVDGLELYRQDGRMHVSLELDLSGLSLGRNGQAVYTPVLVSADGTQSAAFGKIVVNGRNALISEQRRPRLRVKDASVTVARHDGTPQRAGFSGSVPYAAWMDLCTLSLSEDLCGCGDLLSQDRLELSTFDNTPAPAASLSYAEPRQEASKSRSETGSASVDFVSGRTDVRPGYRDNRSEIGKILSTIEKVRSDRNAEITGIKIHGYASPEGPYALNAALARRRTEALTAYVRSLCDLPSGLFTTGSTAEDWAGLRRLVAGSSLPDRDALLAVIDDESLDADAKEEKIKSGHAASYALMLKEWYPSLRRSDYTVSYTVRPFTAAEALEALKTTPGQVSLHEMYRAARTLGPDSEGFHEIMELAARTYPDSPDARYNAAVSMVKRGDLEGARKYLSGVADSGPSLNLRGVIALECGDAASARRLFRQSADRGHSDASSNLELVDRLDALKKQNR